MVERLQAIVEKPGRLKGQQINVPQNLPFRSQLKTAAQRVHRLRTLFQRKAMVLVYHRVSEANVDPWALGVSPLHFDQHLRMLATMAHPISLQELLAAKSDRDLPPKPVCITFDDGYADNLYAAKPALASYRIPATVFITPGYLNVPEDLWWDELAKLVLDPSSRREELSLRLHGAHYSYVFGPSGEASPDTHRTWRAWEAAPGPRQTAYLSLYHLLLKLSHAERDAALEQLRGDSVPYADRRRHRCLTDAELRELASGDLIEIGAHTLNHPVLAELAMDQQKHEIEGSKRQLEALTGKPVTSFAYPYGKKNHYTRHTVRTVRASGFSCACSNFGGLVTRSSDRFALPRFQPLDWDGERFGAMVEQWYRA